MGGWAWTKVVPIIRRGGDEALPVTLTGMGERVHLASEEVGIETAIQDVLNVMKYEDLDDVVLVGHSFAGKVVAAVADRAPERVRMVIYLDAFRPRKVRTPQGSFDPSEFGTSAGWTVSFTEKILEQLGRDIRGADRKWLLSKATPWPKKHATDPVTLSKNFDKVKSAYIFCSLGSDGEYLDQILKAKLDGPHKVIDSGHWPMITKPEELVRDMRSLARVAEP